MKQLTAPKKRTFFIALGAFVLLALLLLLGGRIGGRNAAAAEAASTAEERTGFLRECGWEVDADTEQEQIIHIPETFSPVYEEYNELQKQQGYDLAPFAGQDCTLYTYAVTNWPDAAQTVLANLYVVRGRVIGGDVHSTNLNGFMVGIK